ncbi:MAG TPA: hypothetical protein VKY92_10625 [Verrucomicrobiae bacterium]|nr:hypothetical protein [Verrucomicrobiae bacterium]
MKRELKSWLKAFVLELLVYAILVAVYYFLVLHFLGTPLKNFYVQNRKLYAALALALIVGQGLLLEVITRQFIAWVKPRSEVE